MVFPLKYFFEINFATVERIGTVTQLIVGNQFFAQIDQEILERFTFRLTHPSNKICN